ncbi:hypothetical protein [Solibacillus sp. FSL H8-0538]
MKRSNHRNSRNYYSEKAAVTGFTFKGMIWLTIVLIVGNIIQYFFF